MPRGDADSNRFFEDALGISKTAEDASPDKSPARQIVSIGKALLSESPKEALGRVALKNGISLLARQGFEGTEKVAEGRGHYILRIAHVLNGAFGHGWWDWEPETVERTIREEFKMTERVDLLLEAIGALQVCLRTRQPFENWHIFEKVGIAFGGNQVDFTVLQPLRTDEAAATIALLKELHPKEAFDTEVINYVACCAKHDGLVYLPEKWFGEAYQTALDKLGNDDALRARTQSVWKSHDRNQCQNDAERVQYDSLQEIEEYLAKSQEA